MNIQISVVQSLAGFEVSNCIVFKTTLHLLNLMIFNQYITPLRFVNICVEFLNTLLGNYLTMSGHVCPTRLYK